MPIPVIDGELPDTVIAGRDPYIQEPIGSVDGASGANRRNRTCCCGPPVFSSCLDLLRYVQAKFGVTSIQLTDGPVQGSSLNSMNPLIAACIGGASTGTSLGAFSFAGPYTQAVNTCLEEIIVTLCRPNTVSPNEPGWEIPTITAATDTCGAGPVSGYGAWHLNNSNSLYFPGVGESCDDSIYSISPASPLICINCGVWFYGGAFEGTEAHLFMDLRLYYLLGQQGYDFSDYPTIASSGTNWTRTANSATGATIEKNGSTSDNLDTVSIYLPVPTLNGTSGRVNATDGILTAYSKRIWSGSEIAAMSDASPPSVQLWLPDPAVDILELSTTEPILEWV